MADVFISYARTDREWVETLALEIERAGLTVWWDRQLSYGRSFDATIGAELDAARAVIVVWSKAANQSDWVKDEAQAGRARGVLLPVLKEAIAPPLGFRQAHAADLSRWPDENQREFVKLLAEIGTLTGIDLTPATEAREPRAARPARLTASRRPSYAMLGMLGLVIAAFGLAAIWWMIGQGAPGPAPATTAAETPATPTAGPRTPEAAKAPARTLLATLQTGGGRIRRVALSPDGTRVVAVGDGSDGAYLWDAKSGNEIVRLGTILQDVAEFDGNGDRVATGRIDHLQVWGSHGGEAIGSAGISAGALTSAALSADGRRVVTLSGGAAELWDVDASRLIATLASGEVQARSAVFSPDGARILTADGGHNTATIWNASDGAFVSTLAGHDNSVLDASYSPDGAKIVTASADGTAIIWDPADGKRLALLGFHSSGARRARFSPDGSHVYVMVDDGALALWSASGERIAQMTEQGAAIVDAAFSADGAHLVGLDSAGNAMLWDAKTGAAETTLKSASGSPPTALTLSADAGHVLLARDGTVTVEAIDFGAP